MVDSIETPAVRYVHNVISSTKHPSMTTKQRVRQHRIWKPELIAIPQRCYGLYEHLCGAGTCTLCVKIPQFQKLITLRIRTLCVKIPQFQKLIILWYRHLQLMCQDSAISEADNSEDSHFMCQDSAISEADNHEDS